MDETRQNSVSPRRSSSSDLMISRSPLDAGKKGGAPFGTTDSDVNRYLRFMQRRARTIGIIVITVVVSVGLYTQFIWTRTYRSTVLMLVEPVNASNGSPGLALLENLGRGSRAETEMELARSRNVVGPVVDDLDLHVSVVRNGEPVEPLSVFRSFTANRSTVPGKFSVEPSQGDRVLVRDLGSDSVVAEGVPGGTLQFAGVSAVLPFQPLTEEVHVKVAQFPEVVEAVQARLDIKPTPGDADLFRVECVTETAQSAQTLCDALSASYLRLRTELQQVEATTAARFLEGQVARIHEQLVAAEDSLAAFGRRSRVVALEAQAEEAVKNYAEVKAKRDELDAERAALNVLILQIESKEGDERRYRDLASFPTFLQNLAVTQLVESLVDLDNRRADLALVRTEANPDLVAVNGRIAEIERQLQSIALSYEQALRAQIGSLDQVLAQSGQRMATIPGRQMELARLERRTDLLDDLYRTLQTRLKEAEVAKAVDLPSVRVVDAASKPTRPDSPRLALNLFVALLFGSGLGVGVAMLKEVRDTRIFDFEAQGLPEELGIPVLSTIPRLSNSRSFVQIDDVATLSPGKRETGESQATSVTANVPLAGESDRRGSHGIAIEAFFSLAADLAFAGFGAEGHLRSLAVTSANRRDGKTFITCNLALVEAARGMRVLLVDADVRGAGVSRFLGIAAEPGLSDHILSGTPLSRVLQTVTIGEAAKLEVIAAGRALPHPTGLVESDGFRSLIERVYSDYDVILIDTPPLTVIADAARIARLTDAVMVVVRPGQTDREALEVTLQRLDRSGGQLLGIVLNGHRLSRDYSNRYYYDEAR